MNNVNGIQAQYSIAELTKLLELELAKLIQDLRSNLIPSAGQCEKICALLARYAEAAKTAEGKELQKHNAKRVHFVDYTGGAKAVKDKTLLKNQSAIKILSRAGLEKLVSIHDIGVDQALLGQLLNAKLIAGISDESDQTSADFFALTTKGWAWLTSKEFQKNAENILPIFPARLGIEPDLWNELTFRRAKMIHAYYHEAPSMHEYIIFAFSNNKQLLFGCKVADTVDVSYVCPYSFDEIPSDEDVDTLCEVIEAPELKMLTIISTDDIGINDMPVKIKNTVAAVAANISFTKLGD